ncbi:nucleotide disphospho-sugar-binding domain-containing protein [Parasphingorhabdus pacifica]
MRVLFTTTPGCGHFFPLVPLAWAFRCAGHRVLVAGPRPIAKSVRTAGLEHASVGGNVNPLKLWPDEAGPAGEHDFTAEPWVALAEHTVAETIDLVGQWRPHLIVSDFAEYSGPIAAALSAIPSISQHWGMHISDELSATVFDEETMGRLHALQEQFGLLPAETTPAATVDLCPSSLACFDSTSWLPMQYIPYGGVGLPSPWLWTHRTRPRVCVSMGSVELDAGIDGLCTVAEGLADFDGEVVLTGVGSRNSALSNLPPNVRAAGWLSHDQVFPTCDVVVHHGGSGTAMTALRYGLPQLILPQMCDQFENAARLAGSGAARSIGFADRAAGVVRDEVEELLTEPSYRVHAERIRAEIESMPMPAEIVSTLTALGAGPTAQQTIPASPVEPSLPLTMPSAP